VYSIEYSREAFKSLKAMPRNLATTVREKIEQLAAAPHGPNNNVKKLQGRPCYRLHVGDWRVIYEIHDDRLVVMILAVAPRGGAYQ
jgi:mRNA interferase RelE/StbE